MRILHTSDWHLGRQFHGQGMLEHQAAFVTGLLQDLVRGLPPDVAAALRREVGDGGRQADVT